MKVLSVGTHSEWVDIDPSDEASEMDAQKGLRAKTFLEGTLADLLRADNLVLLCGSGTSLGVPPTSTGAPPSMASLWSDIRDKWVSDFAGILERVRYPVDSMKEDVELLLSHCQLHTSLTPDAEIDQFVTDAERIIAERCRFVCDDSDLTSHESLLRHLARRPIRKPRAKIFTTNYDLCFERAASRLQFVVIDGFSHTEPQEFDGSYFSIDIVRRDQDRDAPDFIPNVFHLYKLHGSVDWQRNGSQVQKNPQADQPLLVYPRQGKYQSSYDQPYLEMMSRLQIALRQPNTGLLVCGFGFNDDHITHPILAAVKSNASLRLVSVSLDADDVTSSARKALRALVAAGDARITLVAGSFDDIVGLIPSGFGASDDDAHRDRMSAALAGF